MYPRVLNECHQAECGRHPLRVAAGVGNLSCRHIHRILEQYCKVHARRRKSRERANRRAGQISLACHALHFRVHVSPITFLGVGHSRIQLLKLYRPDRHIACSESGDLRVSVQTTDALPLSVQTSAATSLEQLILVLPIHWACFRRQVNFWGCMMSNRAPVGTNRCVELHAIPFYCTRPST